VNRNDGIRAAGAVLLALGAGAAWGGDIPVHREYSRSIQLYDDRGGLAHYDGEAPDRTAWQRLRDTQAQEGLMGRETLLDLGFRSGESVFGWTSRSSGGMPVPPPARAEEDRGTRDSDSGRNWLVQSLSLPTLGGGASNAAVAMSAGGKPETGWGWLADRVAASDREGVLESGEPETANEGEEWLPDGRNPYTGETELSGTEGLAAARRPAETAETGAAAGGEPETERMREPIGPLVRDDPQPVGARAEAGASVPVLPEMSRTREMLGDLMRSAKPDAAGWNDAAEAWSDAPLPSAGRAAGGMAWTPSRPVSDTPVREAGFSMDASSAGRGGGVMPVMGRSGAGMPNSAPSGWQGGWKAQSIRESGMGTYVPSARPMTLPAAAPSVRTPPVLPAGAGMKPGWY